MGKNERQNKRRMGKAKVKNERKTLGYHKDCWLLPYRSLRLLQALNCSLQPGLVPGFLFI